MEQKISESTETPENLLPKNNTNKTIFKFYFLMFGVGSMLSWNAILSCLDFFEYYQKDFNVPQTYPLLNISLNLVLQFTQMCVKKQRFRRKNKLILGLILSVILVLAMPFSAICFERNSKIGFSLAAILVLLQGFVNAIKANSFFGITSYFGVEYIVWFSFGQGISAIFLNVIRYIVLAAVNIQNDEQKQQNVSSVAFFVTAGLISFGVLICLIKAFRTDFFKETLRGTGELNDDISDNDEKLRINSIIDSQRSTVQKDVIENNEDNNQNNENNENNLDLKDTTKDTNDSEDNYKFFQFVKQMLDVCILASIIYISTFFVFPGICFKQTLFDLKKYKVNTISTIYNVFDTLGRYLVKKTKPTKVKLYLSALIRLIFLVLLPLNYYCDLKLHWNIKLLSSLTIIYVTFVGLTNGIAHTYAFGVAASLFEGKMKAKAGGTVGFFFCIGIFVGSLLAFFVVTLILKKIEEK